ncbi:preprotein translocase subunit SecA [Thermotomaculum hydrothermale]|uniref:Protein translocase subunit SecA n=1 Tax=Thermotomaculum hydrothermale TaxID=981385 RepID=A0A7R6SYH7_9BACT|nr:preprotein translocase subunit SecA [Thermotomaculum hydrothermale]BBB31742.1 preprotein translocase subunit SecA [Thermotomaculum hydrothermale]
MFNSIVTKIFGTKNDRYIKSRWPIVEKVNSLEPEYEKYTDGELKEKIQNFKEIVQQRYKEGEKLQKILDEILPDVFAIVRETAKRKLNMRHFDVQVLGGIVLHEGKIAEMKTGEGKTLVATLPVVLNALAGRGVHVVTVNDYLAQRDAEWMGKVYNALGLSVGVIKHGLDDQERKEAYNCDITYGTNNEFGFDYLRDNMKYYLEDCVQRDYYYAIVDEVDSILIDEARTPLIISGPSEESTEKYYVANSLIPKLKEGEDYEVDEKENTAVLTEKGIAKAEKILGVPNLYDPSNIELLHCIEQALKAHTLFQKDVDYIVKDNEVIIVDEFTGRLMPGRRFSDGLHQALEAKEGVKIQSENQTLATITFQNYFRMYEKLSGMTGTADTEAAEFKKIYDLDVIVIPTNKPMIRKDYPDVVYRTEREKFNAIVKEIERLHKKGQPVLVGTVSIENSEKLSNLLKKKGIKHVVLNAKHHEKEAEIVAQAGRKGAVTIATNMAGRGTDIVLGGNPEMLAKSEIEKLEAAGKELTEEEKKEIYEKFKKQCEKEKQEVLEAGGLFIIGSERHESRRIDNQLRGRSGRQGDPGASRFYLSLEDDLMRIFGSDKISGIMQRLGMEEGVPIEHNMISKSIERAQKQVENRNFEIRKQLLEYDSVMNQQRETFYKLRRKVLEGTVRDYVFELTKGILEWLEDQYIGDPKHPNEWNAEEYAKKIKEYFAYDISPDEVRKIPREKLTEEMYERVTKAYQEKVKKIGDEEMFKMHERFVALQFLDRHWKDHLLNMDHLKDAIGLRGYGQKDPIIEYKKESFALFEDMMSRVEDNIIKVLYWIQPASEEQVREEKRKAKAKQKRLLHASVKDKEAPVVATVKRDKPKIGRNDPCPCGSGKKYKKCCGRNER